MRVFAILLLVSIQALSQIPCTKDAQAVDGAATEKQSKKAENSDSKAEKPKTSPVDNLAISPSKTTAAEQANSDNRRIADYTAELAKYTKVLVFVGIGQILVFITQAVIFWLTLRENRKLIRATVDSANAAGSSADTARDALLLTQRADVLLEGVHMSDDGELISDTVISLKFRNFGRTRANGLRPNFWIGVESVGEGVNQNSLTTSLLGTGDYLSISFPRMEDVAGSSIIDLRAGEATLVFRGELLYEDVFGQQHRTRCSGIYNHRTFGFDVEKNDAD